MIYVLFCFNSREHDEPRFSGLFSTPDRAKNTLKTMIDLSAWEIKRGTWVAKMHDIEWFISEEEIDEAYS